MGLLISNVILGSGVRQKAALCNDNVLSHEIFQRISFKNIRIFVWNSVYAVHCTIMRINMHDKSIRNSFNSRMTKGMYRQQICWTPAY